MASAPQLYKQYIGQLTSLSMNSAKGKQPANFNLHKLVKSPFHPVQTDSTLVVRQNFIKKISDRFASRAAVDPETPEAFVSDLPLPICIKRHVDVLSPIFSGNSHLNKVSGFMIQVKGRRGSRSTKQLLSYGNLNIKSFDTKFADFGRSFYVHKKGVTGVKVWIGYNR